MSELGLPTIKNKKARKEESERVQKSKDEADAFLKDLDDLLQ